VQKVDVHRNGNRRTQRPQHVEDLGAQVDADLLIHVHVEGHKILGRLLRIARQQRLHPGVIHANASK
jgi:hypothetical protein